MKLSKIASICILGLFSANPLFAEKENLGEITILGAKLGKSLQETTQSVQVFTDIDFLNSSKMNDMYDIFDQTTNVNRHGTFAINIRGISSTGTAGTSVGARTIEVNIDGVSQGFYASREGAVSTWDMAQAEFLKGPQSTTQGRNSLAGAIILKTKDPEFEANGAIELGYASYNTSNIAIMQTGAITENLAFRLSLEKKQTDGFIKNDILAKDNFNKNELLTLRGKLLYEFENGANILLSLSKTANDENGYYFVSSTNPYDRKSNWNTDGHWNSKTQSHSLEINYPLNNTWALKSITSFADENFHRLSDVDSNRGMGINNTFRDSDNISQEFRFIYKSDKLDSILGLYYTKGLGTNDSIINDWDVSTFLDAPAGTVILDYTQNLKEDYTNIALFFNSDYHISDKFTLITGLRLDKDERDNVASIISQSTYGALLGSGNIKAEENTVNLLPKFGFDYKWNKNINTGLVYSKGYRPGGISVNPVRVESKTYDAEYTNNIEASFRSQWLNKRLKVNANVFYTEWNKQQVTENLSAINQFDTHIINAGKSTIKGIELESKFQLNNEVAIFGSAGYVKTKFDEYNNNGNDYSGHEFKYTPNITANFGTTYRNKEGYFTHTNLAYTGQSYTSNANTQKTASRTITNIKLGYEEKEWAFYIYANNLFDKEYLYRNTSKTYDVGEPRVIGFNLNYTW